MSADRGAGMRTAATSPQDSRESTQAEASAGGSSEEPSSRFPWRSLLLPAVLFVLVFIQAGTLSVKDRAGSPWDEAAHFDYIVQIQKGNFPVPAGGLYSDEAIQAWACRPTDRGMSIAWLCGKANVSGDPSLPFHGVNYEAPFGPVYYAIAAGGSSVLSNFGIDDFTGARLMSALLYALGAASLLLVAQRMAFSSLAAGGLILAASATPQALSLGATVTPDSVAFLGAAAVIAAAMLSRTWRSAVVTTAVVGAIAGLTKPNFIVIAVLGSTLLLFRWISLERPTVSWQTARRFLMFTPAMFLPVLFSAAASAGWAVLAEARNTTGLPADGGVHSVIQSTEGPTHRVAQQLSMMLRPDFGTAFSVLDTPVLDVVAQALVLMILGGCFCALLWRIEADPRGIAVLRSIAVAIPVSAAALVAIYWISYQGGITTSPRYGLPFLAAASLGVGVAIRRRVAIPAGLLGLGVWLCSWSAVAR